MRENSRQSQTRLSVSNRAELLAGYADGVPVRELATRFNVHRGTVREIARQAGLAARRPELPDAIRVDAAQLYAGGMTLAQVAARLGVSHEAVRSAVLACGGTIRAAGRSVPAVVAGSAPEFSHLTGYLSRPPRHALLRRLLRWASWRARDGR
ncbi:helix-turn-helix domain-containing protein [Antrihabitans spumae]|uniref:Helix-turn-helix domain-containing protein n=1 Tax=Antrihabitans spumae TaxID=3373370 RepID=A0ABW7KE56_9NOCA